MQTSATTYKHTNPTLFYGGAAVVDYYGADNNNYVAGEGFCCGDNDIKTKSIADDSPNYEKLQYYYHSDHLGSASYITNLDGEVVQHIEYVPFGEVFLEERNNTWNTPFLFNGKELDEETGLYYYGARYYNPRISLWYGVDPLAEKRPHMSPYNYCSWNPIMKIDPDGMDEWELDKKGNITNRIENKEHDSFHIMDDDGNRTASTRDFDKGTVISHRSEKTTYSKRNSDGSRTPADTEADIYKIRGDANATEIFEFVADNTDVEWSQFMTGEAGDRGLNFLTTGHIEYTEPGGSALWTGQLSSYTIREHIHNHPSNTPYPSGIPNFTGTTGDVSFAGDVESYISTYYYSGSPYGSRPIPKFYIYLPNSGNKIRYSGSSVKSDFVR